MTEEQVKKLGEIAGELKALVEEIDSQPAKEPEQWPTTLTEFANALFAAFYYENSPLPQQRATQIPRNVEQAKYCLRFFRHLLDEMELELSYHSRLATNIRARLDKLEQS